MHIIQIKQLNKNAFITCKKMMKVMKSDSFKLTQVKSFEKYNVNNNSKKEILQQLENSNTSMMQPSNSEFTNDCFSPFNRKN